MTRLITPLIVTSLILAISGCTNQCITSQPHEQLDTLESQINELEGSVPPEFLIKCNWLTPIKEDTQTNLLKVNQENHSKFTECYIRHNSWVEWQTSKTGGE